MRLDSIRRQLQPYSILGRRKTTISHAFASAIAPADPWDELRCVAAMNALGQTDMDRLRCTYCDQPAETWDHLNGLVRSTRFSGYGHTLGNLVPCCKPCNSRKGNRPWKMWMETAGCGAERIARVEAFAQAYGAYSMDEDEMAARFPDEFAELSRIRNGLFDLMDRADEVAGRIRAAVQQQPEQFGESSASPVQHP